MRNLFVLSLALNVSLILRTMYEREQSHHWLSFETQKGQAVQKTRLALSSSSSSSAATTQVDTQDGGEKILNLARLVQECFFFLWFFNALILSIKFPNVSLISFLVFGSCHIIYLPAQAIYLLKFFFPHHFSQQSCFFFRSLRFWLIVFPVRALWAEREQLCSSEIFWPRGIIVINRNGHHMGWKVLLQVKIQGVLDGSEVWDEVMSVIVLKHKGVIVIFHFRGHLFIVLLPWFCWGEGLRSTELDFPAVDKDRSLCWLGFSMVDVESVWGRAEHP